MPKSWAALVPENSAPWRHLSRPVSVACRFAQESTRVRLIFEVSRMDDAALRMKLVESLREAGFKLTKLAFKEHAKYSRFYTSPQPVSDWGDEDEVTAAIEKLLRKAEEPFKKAEAVLQSVFRL